MEIDIPFNVKCSFCNVDIIVYPDRYYKRKNFFCSRKCNSEYRKIHCKTKVECKCSVCGEKISLKKSQYNKRNKNGKITCSLKCSGKLKKEIYSGRKNPNCKYKTLPDDFFENINSEEKAYVLGWIASDGSISKKGDIVIEINKRDTEILEKITNIVCSEIPVIDDGEKGENSFIRFCSKRMCKDVCNLLSISYGKKDHIINMPEINEQSNIWAFIRGFFDGDGCIIKLKDKRHYLQASIFSNSQIFREKVRDFVGIKCSHSYKNKVLVWSGKNALLFLDKLYLNAKIYLNRKYKKYIQWKELYQQ